MRQRRNLSRFHEHDIIGVLHFAFDEQKRLFRDHEPEALKQIRSDDRIRDSGLIFQADENKSFRRPRPLTANHIPGDLDGRSMFRLRQIARPPDLRQRPRSNFIGCGPVVRFILS